ncbi:hypothetical protein [Streptomyces sp. CA-146814]|uniref:hypothetical protein n=1 Tax=Streptomyces sp. CA-146814 TaxID=3240053 RepID=UPI003D92ADE9
MTLRTVVLDAILAVLPGARPDARVTVEQPLHHGGRDTWTGTAALLADRITDAIEGKDTGNGESTAHRLRLIQNVLAGAALHWNPAGKRPAALYAAQAAAVHAAGLVHTPEEIAELETRARTVYRAEHDTIPAGLYTTEAEARRHCESRVRDEYPVGVALFFDWIGDEDDPEEPRELVVQVGRGDEVPTGYAVVPLEVADEFDPDAE